MTGGQPQKPMNCLVPFGRMDRRFRIEIFDDSSKRCLPRCYSLAFLGPRAGIRRSGELQPTFSPAAVYTYWLQILER